MYLLYVLFQNLCIEGHPFITRFKTYTQSSIKNPVRYCIEGHPFITRFKTRRNEKSKLQGALGIEGHPFITRFKTRTSEKYAEIDIAVLKVIHL